MKGLDYGAEVVKGSRVVDVARRDRVGTLMVIEDRCHWRNQDSYSDQWRPRSAYVLWDDTKPRRSGFHPDAPYSCLSLSYLPPERLSVVPVNWVHPLGIGSPSRGKTFTAPECLSAAVLRRSAGTWLLLNRRERGLGESAYQLPSLGHLQAAWSLMPMTDSGKRVVSRQDEHGIYWPLVGAPVMVAP